MNDRGIDQYFQSRLIEDARRETLWTTLCSHVFQKYVPKSAVVVELGAARGEFINNINAHRRIAVDQWKGVVESVAPAVEAHVRSVMDLGFIEDRSVDVVFASNLVEHLEVENVRTMVREICRILADGGRLILVQPNFRTSYRRYFDDYTHASIWTDVSLPDFLRAEGLEIERVDARFLPLTVKSRIPIHPLLIRLYLLSPIKPLAGQMLVIAGRDGFEKTQT